ncbi:MAG: MoaD/ThiS family protein, partial [Methanobacterium sp.]|jgi:sulfur carrier protein
MKITVTIGDQNEVKEISNSITIKDLLKILEIPSETVVVKKNEYIVINEEFVEEGDNIEIIKVIFGG